MIGHVFTSSGAVCLALAPSAERADEYVVLAITESGYAVASIFAAALTADGRPQHWTRASYYGHGTREENRREAVRVFAEETGRKDDAGLDDTIQYAERLAGHLIAG